MVKTAAKKGNMKVVKGTKALEKKDNQADIVPVLKTMGFEIISASIKSNEHTLNVTYQKLFEGFKSNNVAEECHNEVHHDLRIAFDKLKPHFVIICDMKESSTYGIPLGPDEWNAKILEKIKVTGFILKGEEDKRAIILTGQKKINNRVLCMNTPLMEFEDAQFPYEHVDELVATIEEIKKEIMLYFSGKFAPASQQSLELEETTEEEEEA